MKALRRCTRFWGNDFILQDFRVIGEFGVVSRYGMVRGFCLGLLRVSFFRSEFSKPILADFCQGSAKPFRSSVTCKFSRPSPHRIHVPGRIERLSLRILALSPPSNAAYRWYLNLKSGKP